LLAGLLKKPDSKRGGHILNHILNRNEAKLVGGAKKDDIGKQGFLTKGFMK